MLRFWVIPPYCVAPAVGKTDYFCPMGLRGVGLAPNFWPFGLVPPAYPNRPPVP
jgi:hypothetical protein